MAPEGVQPGRHATLLTRGAVPAAGGGGPAWPPRVESPVGPCATSRWSSLWRGMGRRRRPGGRQAGYASDARETWRAAPVTDAAAVPPGSPDRPVVRSPRRWVGAYRWGDRCVLCPETLAAPRHRRRAPDDAGLARGAARGASHTGDPAPGASPHGDRAQLRHTEACAPHGTSAPRGAHRSSGLEDKRTLHPQVGGQGPIFQA